MDTKENSTAQWVVYGILGLVALKALRDLFSAVGDTLGMGPESDAVKQGAALFADASAMPELWDPNALLTAVGKGQVTLADLDGLVGYANAIDHAVAQYHGAKGVVMDSEADAIGAVASMPNHTALLVMAENFAANYHMTMGAYGLGFMEPKTMAAVALAVTKLRNR